MSEKKIAVATGTSPEGTSISGMLAGCNKHGFKSKSFENSSLTDIKGAIRRGVPVVVNYMEPEDYEDHFAMVVSVGTKYIVLNDPWNGRSFRVERKDFMKRWWGWSNDKKKKVRKWMMTVEKRVEAT